MLVFPNISMSDEFLNLLQYHWYPDELGSLKISRLAEMLASDSLQLFKSRYHCIRMFVSINKILWAGVRLLNETSSMLQFFAWKLFLWHLWGVAPVNRLESRRGWPPLYPTATGCQGNISTDGCLFVSRLSRGRLNFICYFLLPCFLTLSRSFHFCVKGRLIKGDLTLLSVGWNINQSMSEAPAPTDSLNLMHKLTAL